MKKWFGLCELGGWWHWRRVFRAFHGKRFCADCWQREMTFLPTSTRAWRIEHTGVAT